MATDEQPGIRVLIVEDNPGDFRLIQETLTRARAGRFELIRATRVGEAIAYLKQDKFDVILLDLSLPDSQGYDTFTSVHQQASQIPIIILSGIDDENLALRAVQAGAQDYLVKGYRDNEYVLVRAIRYAIERYRLIADRQAEYDQKLEQQERERLSMERLSGPARASVTAQMFGLIPLRDSLPEIFTGLVEQYGRFMDLALEERAFKVDRNISDELRSLAEHIGFFKAGPRDVIEIHSAALKQKTREAPPQKVQAYLEESRLMVLELMGYLVSYYRNYSLGIRSSTPAPAAGRASSKTAEGNDHA